MLRICSITLKQNKLATHFCWKLSTVAWLKQCFVFNRFMDQSREYRDNAFFKRSYARQFKDSAWFVCTLKSILNHKSLLLIMLMLFQQALNKMLMLFQQALNKVRFQLKNKKINLSWSEIVRTGNTKKWLPPLPKRRLSMDWETNMLRARTYINRNLWSLKLQTKT